MQRGQSQTRRVGVKGMELVVADSTDTVYCFGVGEHTTPTSAADNEKLLTEAALVKNGHRRNETAQIFPRLRCSHKQDVGTVGRRWGVSEKQIIYSVRNDANLSGRDVEESIEVVRRILRWCDYPVCCVEQPRHDSSGVDSVPAGHCLGPANRNKIVDRHHKRLPPPGKRNAQQR